MSFKFPLGFAIGGGVAIVGVTGYLVMKKKGIALFNSTPTVTPTGFGNTNMPPDTNVSPTPPNHEISATSSWNPLTGHEQGLLQHRDDLNGAISEKDQAVLNEMIALVQKSIFSADLSAINDMLPSYEDGGDKSAFSDSVPENASDPRVLATIIPLSSAYAATILNGWCPQYTKNPLSASPNQLPDGIKLFIPVQYTDAAVGMQNLVTSLIKQGSSINAPANIYSEFKTQYTNADGSTDVQRMQGDLNAAITNPNGLGGFYNSTVIGDFAATYKRCLYIHWLSEGLNTNDSNFVGQAVSSLVNQIMDNASGYSYVNIVQGLIDLMNYDPANLFPLFPNQAAVANWTSKYYVSATLPYVISNQTYPQLSNQTHVIHIAQSANATYYNYWYGQLFAPYQDKANKSAALTQHIQKLCLNYKATFPSKSSASTSVGSIAKANVLSKTRQIGTARV